MELTFTLLTSYLNKIASTRSRLKIHAILTKLFEIALHDENKPFIDKIMYLTQGRLDSSIEGTKFGISEKTVIEAIAKVSVTSIKKVETLLSTHGDLGEVTQKLLTFKESRNKGTTLAGMVGMKKTEKTLAISQLYDMLSRIPKISGEGSTKRKIDVMMKMYQQSDPVCAKYITNILLGRLRIGIATRSIMDGIAEAGLGSKEKRSLVEEKFSIYPDLGHIGKIIAYEGEKGLHSIHITIGTPIRMMLASRLPYQKIPPKFDNSPFLAEYKYDGERIQAHKDNDRVVLFSRHLKDITSQYPDVVRYIQNHVKAQKCIIEGECVAMDRLDNSMLPFQVVSTRRRKYDIEKMIDDVPVTLFCFDCLYVEGKDIRKEDALDRRNKLIEIIEECEGLKIAHSRIINNTKEMLEYFKQSRQDGAEGIMNKDIREGSIYDSGNRKFYWIKMKSSDSEMKLLDTIDTIIVGANYGKGKRSGLFGSFYLAIYDDTNDDYYIISKCGSGFSDDDLECITKELEKNIISSKYKKIVNNVKVDVWFNPSIVLEIAADEITLSTKYTINNDINGYSLRFPIFQRIRKDKGINDITTIYEIKDLYNSQFNFDTKY